MNGSSAVIWREAPGMDAGAPDPATVTAADTLWVAYRTRRGDHFSIVKFSGVEAWTLGPADGDRHLVEGWAFHRVEDAGLRQSGLRRWVATFADDTLEVTARVATVVVRAIQARDGQSALAMIHS